MQIAGYTRKRSQRDAHSQGPLPRGAQQAGRPEGGDQKVGAAAGAVCLDVAKALGRAQIDQLADDSWAR